MSTTRTYLGRTFALAAAAALTLSACGNNGGGGSDDDSPIGVGIIADLTGATGDVGTPYNKGMLAYIDWLNGEGGIEGREIDARSNDYAYEVPQAEDLYRQYVNAGVVAIQGWGTGDTEALEGRVADDELPFMSGSFAESLVDPSETPYNFVVAATYSDQMRVALNWINEDSGGDAEVAVFHHDSPFGQAPVADGEAWVEEQGYDLGYQSYAMPAGTPNYVGQLSQARSQGAEYIVIQNVGSPAAQVARDIEEQGLDMKIVCLNWCAHEGFITAAGSAAEGHMLIQPFAPLISDKPGHENIKAYMEENNVSESDVTVSYVQGWAVMDVMAQGMRKVLEDGDELDGAALKEALETMGAIDTGGLIGTGEVEFSGDSHRGTSASGIYTVENGEMVEVEAGATP
ncbi:ABC transporter substrate-binding protein [Ornithinimicrobium sp. Y1694]|uniref:ABC transporter substrate-binding protein n=1 Tax=Ornithinimicrobium sp. Y1694 TaxID=3418590 RepID=UPI003CE86D91